MRMTNKELNEIELVGKGDLELVLMEYNGAFITFHTHTHQFRPRYLQNVMAENYTTDFSSADIGKVKGWINRANKKAENSKALEGVPVLVKIKYHKQYDPATLVKRADKNANRSSWGRGTRVGYIVKYPDGETTWVEDTQLLIVRKGEKAWKIARRLNSLHKQAKKISEKIKEQNKKVLGAAYKNTSQLIAAAK